MITRIEIDGFKSFESFALDLPPFLALIGTNASGKSNLLDALTFVSTAGVHGLDAAVAAVRGDARSLFRRRGDGIRVDRMSFALEFILGGLPQHVPNRWRYELDLVWAEPEDELEGIAVRGQRLVGLSADQDRWRGLDGMAPEWVTSGLIRHKASRVIEIPSELPASFPESSGLLLYMTRGPKRDRSGAQASNDPSSLFSALLVEFAGVRFLHLEAGALRQPSELGGPRHMTAAGRDLPNYLRHLARETGSKSWPLGVVGEIKMHLVGLVREVSDFAILEDERRRDVRLEFSSPYEQGLGADLASDGTLRMLAILAVLHDHGTMAVEEPENGVFPERLRQLLGLAQGLVTDLREPPERDDDGSSVRYRQAIFTSHSPVVLDAVPYANIAFLDMTTVLEDGKASRVSRVRWLREGGGPVRVEGERWPRVTDSELNRFRAGLEEPV
ncbi:AAA family ATPase [Sphaerisporangium sp. NPDC049002]|uniref:AAA family ATPase n=1 Tax=unclassified Sphaerisporangium TaxID=2630420 RepID=UPI0033C7EDD5